MFQIRRIANIQISLCSEYFRKKKEKLSHGEKRLCVLSVKDQTKHGDLPITQTLWVKTLLRFWQPRIRGPENIVVLLLQKRYIASLSNHSAKKKRKKQRTEQTSCRAIAFTFEQQKKKINFVHPIASEKKKKQEKTIQ